MEQNKIDIERQHKFDEICGVAHVNIFTLTKDCDCIPIAPFDPNNPEHLFVLHIAKGVAGVVGKEVCVDANWFQLRKLNRGLREEYRYKKVNGRDIVYAVNPDLLLNYMRDYARQECGESFSFREIYEEFFAPKVNNR